LLIAALHGHIHGAPYRSGSIQTVIENTVCINPGQNEGRGSNLRYVILELAHRPPPPQIQIIYKPEI
jgi:Icc-related predicted phosphoesterase